MPIIYSPESQEFHLHNNKISYIMQILPNGQIGNLYYGKQIRHKSDFSYLLEGGLRALAVYTKENEHFFCPQYTKMEYPCSGRGDFRESAFEIRQANGSRITDFQYESHVIYSGKKKLENLPATYVSSEEEAETLEITLVDKLLQTECILVYSIFRDYPVITRNVRFVNHGEETVYLEKALSANVDLPDSDYEMLQLSGAWSRERDVVYRKLGQGIQGITSRRGTSSAEHNPFIAIKRSGTTEQSGEVYGFSFVYSGNHIEQIEVDTCNMARIQIGIHPDNFEWGLTTEETFQTPEVVMVYSQNGLNGMSQTYHKLFSKHLIRGKWKDKERPILINNWEATGAEFTQEQLLTIAKTGKELGIELFVIDDGWFGKRDDDKAGLGDWHISNERKLPDGIEGLAKKVKELGMDFGIWIEPEMVNMDSDLYRMHNDWVICAPGRTPSPSRNQYVLDYSSEEVVEYMIGVLTNLLSKAPISYVKWDMNRYITECYSLACDAGNQGKVMHKYILGVYRLYEQLTASFPDILFESCSSGGARFDPGMLYYAPQTWTSDDSDAMERVRIQYGTSYVYPLGTMGAHVSEVPNQQVGRTTSIQTRGNVALFGLLGYELDINCLSKEEKKTIKEQIKNAKKYRKLVMDGTFYRLLSPFENNNSAWMIVSEEKEEALVGFYQMRSIPNGEWVRIKLSGLLPNADYVLEDKPERIYGGDELMNVGMIIPWDEIGGPCGDYFSRVYHFIQKTK